MDVLSDVLSAVRMTGAIYFDVDAGTPWVGESPGTAEIAAAIMPSAEHIISFHIVIDGCCAAMSDGSLPPIKVTAGDVIIFPGGDPNVLSSEIGERSAPNIAMYYRPIDQHLPFAFVHGGDGPERTHFICGYLGCDVRPFNPLIAALPPMLCARKPENDRDWVTNFFRLAIAEGGSGRVGGETILAKLSELMFAQVIRHHVESLPEESRGWLAGLRDPQVGTALRLMHAQPSEPWTLDRLAREAGLSRSTFAERFTAYVGISPMQYLARWRLQLAGRLLEQPGVSIAQAGAEVGYESEAAFNRAFKKLVGTPPGTWRKTRGQAGNGQALD